MASRNANNGLSHKRYTAAAGAKINPEYLCLLYQVLHNHYEFPGTDSPGRLCLTSPYTCPKPHHLFRHAVTNRFSTAQKLLIPSRKSGDPPDLQLRC